MNLSSWFSAMFWKEGVGLLVSLPLDVRDQMIMQRKGREEGEEGEEKMGHTKENKNLN